MYAPNIDDPSFFGLLEHKVSEMGNYPVIMGGDFNRVRDPVLDRQPSTPRPRRSVNILKDMCEGLGLVDIWRLHNPTSREYTFFSPPHGSLSRIDYFFISDSIVSSTLSCSIGSIHISDHAHVMVYILPNIKSIRSPRWRMNSSLLLDSGFRESLRAQITLFKETNLPTAPSMGVAREALKAFLRGFVIQHATYKKKLNKVKETELEKQIKSAENAYKQNMSPTNLTQITRLKYQFNTILTAKAEFALFRARQKQFEEGDRAGKMLARYIKQRESMSAIPAIEHQGRGLLTNPTDINIEFKQFYSNLYVSELQANEDEIRSFLSSLSLPTLTEEQREFLDTPITVEEVVEVISSLPSGKSPGLDGFTAEFYKCYAAELAPLLLDMYNEAFETGTLPPTLMEAVITVVLKSGKNPTDCKNDRPISLLGYDEKVLSKLLSLRLNKVITLLGHPDQVGFIPKRSYADNIRRLINIMWATRNNDSPAAAISLDAEKAFDRVEWLYLFLALESFGFSNKFITWIRLLYTHPRAAVLTNGLISPWFELSRGTRQGDGISLGLFALPLEPLATSIRLEPAIPDFQIGQLVHKHMQTTSWFSSLSLNTHFLRSSK